MKISILGICLSSLFLIACEKVRDNSEIPKEGDIVTWKQNDHLIIKTKLGERRKHIVDTHCKRCEAEFYQPQNEHYVGQFPIDYVPEKFPPISKKEADGLPIPYAINQLEFNLILNNSSVQATDESIYGKNGLDDKDQVKVMVFNEKLTNRTRDVINTRLSKYPNDFNLEISKKYGMQCWIFEKTSGLKCYGQSSYDKSVGVLFTHMGGNWVSAKSWEPLYGNIVIKWRIDKRNLHRWKEVDAAIWKLLEQWNVSPIQNEN